VGEGYHHLRVRLLLGCELRAQLPRLALGALELLVEQR